MKMMGDNQIPYINGYQISGLTAIIAENTNIKHAADYPPVQSTIELLVTHKNDFVGAVFTVRFKDANGVVNAILLSDRDADAAASDNDKMGRYKGKTIAYAVRNNVLNESNERVSEIKSIHVRAVPEALIKYALQNEKDFHVYYEGKKKELSDGHRPDIIPGGSEALSSFLRLHHLRLKVKTEILPKIETMQMPNSVRTGNKSIIDVSAVAEKYAEYLEGTDISIPDNVVTPQLLEALKKKGIPIEVTGKVKNAEGEKNCVRELPDGTKYVEADTDQDIFKNDKTIEDFQRTAKKYLLEHFRGKDIFNGVSMSRADVLKYVYKHMEDAQKKRYKLQASTEVDNLLRVERNKTHGLDINNKHPEATGGWDYYEVIYHVGGKWFKGLTNIMKTEEGDKLYDINKIEELEPRSVFKAELGGNNSSTEGNILQYEGTVNGESDIDSYSMRDERQSIRNGTKSIRQLLSDALLSEVTDAEDINALKEYQTRIQQLDADTNYLNDLLMELDNVAMSTNDRKNVEARVQMFRQRLAAADKTLVDMQKSGVLQNVIRAEKMKQEIHAMREAREALEVYKQGLQAKDMRNTIKRQTDRLAKWITEPSNKGSVPEVFRGTVAEFLTSIQQSVSSDFDRKHELRFLDRMRKLEAIVKDMEDSPNRFCAFRNQQCVL